MTNFSCRDLFLPIPNVPCMKLCRLAIKCPVYFVNFPGQTLAWPKIKYAKIVCTKVSFMVSRELPLYIPYALLNNTQ